MPSSMVRVARACVLAPHVEPYRRMCVVILGEGGTGKNKNTIPVFFSWARWVRDQIRGGATKSGRSTSETPLEPIWIQIDMDTTPCMYTLT